jgi:predicted HAD superfamily phosphohydrolase YqeG
MFRLPEEEEPQVMEIPLLPPIKGKEYTLVLDLDDTLIKFEEKVKTQLQY